MSCFSCHFSSSLLGSVSRGKTSESYNPLAKKGKRNGAEKVQSNHFLNQFFFFFFFFVFCVLCCVCFSFPNYGILFKLAGNVLRVLPPHHIHFPMGYFDRLLYFLLPSAVWQCGPTWNISISYPFCYFLREIDINTHTQAYTTPNILYIHILFLVLLYHIIRPPIDSLVLRVFLLHLLILYLNF